MDLDLTEQAPGRGLSLSSREIYLYAQFVALCNEQGEALLKLAQGRAGFWARGRIGPRSARIKAVLGDIVRIEIEIGEGPISYALQRFEKKLLANEGDRIGRFTDGGGSFGTRFVSEVEKEIVVEEALAKLRD